MIDDLVDELAFRLRYISGAQLAHDVDDTEQRWDLLVDVVFPRPRLLEASRAAARQQLERRTQRSAAA